MAQKRKPLSINAPKTDEDLQRVLNGIPVQDQSMETVREEPIAPVKRGRGRPRKEESEIDKARVTYYLPVETLGQLEELYDGLRAMLPYEDKVKVKKSQLVDFALNYIFEDYKDHGEESLISREIKNL